MSSEPSAPKSGEATKDIVASVVVGSVNGGEWVFALLQALRHQRTDLGYEVIIADRCEDGTAERIEREYPEVKLLRASPDTTLPELRTMALEASQGRYIFVTEDHTVPPPNWIDRFSRALDDAPPRIVAVGGPVDNVMTEDTVDWAAFLCEYSQYLPPLETGETHDIPGMNIAYRKSVFDGVDRALLTKGFWESIIHPQELGKGNTFLRLGDVVMGHRKHFGFGYFMSQRYHYSRYFAGVRFDESDRTKRLAYTALSGALPPLVLSRVARAAFAKPDYRSATIRSLPAICAFSVAWAVGEAVGYAAGPANSLVEIE